MRKTVVEVEGRQSLQTPLGYKGAELSLRKSELLEDVRRILTNAKKKVKIDRRAPIFSRKKRLSSEDLKTPQDPEEFTKKNIIEKVFDFLELTTALGRGDFVFPEA